MSGKRLLEGAREAPQLPTEVLRLVGKWLRPVDQDLRRDWLPVQRFSSTCSALRHHFFPDPSRLILVRSHMSWCTHCYERRGKFQCTGRGSTPACKNYVPPEKKAALAYKPLLCADCCDQVCNYQHCKRRHCGCDEKGFKKCKKTSCTEIYCNQCGFYCNHYRPNTAEQFKNMEAHQRDVARFMFGY